MLVAPGEVPGRRTPAPNRASCDTSTLTREAEAREVEGRTPAEMEARGRGGGGDDGEGVEKKWEEARALVMES